MYVPPEMTVGRATQILKRWSEVRHLAIQAYMSGALAYQTPEDKPLTFDELMSTTLPSTGSIPISEVTVTLLTFEIVCGQRSQEIRCEGIILEDGHNF